MDAWHIDKSARFWSNAKGTKDEVALKQLVVWCDRRWLRGEQWDTLAGQPRTGSTNYQNHQNQHQPQHQQHKQHQECEGP